MQAELADHAAEQKGQGIAPAWLRATTEQQFDETVPFAAEQQKQAFGGKKLLDGQVVVGRFAIVA